MALWTPANLSGSKLHRWIKGSSFTTSGGSITGGTTSDSSASTITKVSTNWPTYNASGLNGYSTITSGGSNLMSIPVDIDYDCSVFVVFKPNAIGGYHNLYEQSGDKCPMLWIDSSNRYSMNGAGAAIEPSSPLADGSAWRVVSTINRSSGTRSEERIDGTSKGTNGESVGILNVGTGLTLKLLGRSSGNGLQGDVAEIVVTYGALTSDDEARIEGYLAWKYGLQSQLDSGHTYFAAAPTVASDPEGTLAVTLASATLAATGTVAVTGSVAKTLGSATCAATGAVAATGSVAKTLADATGSGTGTVAVTGAVARTLADSTLAATGAVEVRATLAVTLADTTATSAGGTESGGTVAKTLADATLVATGTAAAVGALASTLAPATSIASGTVSVSGALSCTLADATLTGAGTVLGVGSVAATLADTTLTATGGVSTGASVAVTLAAATSIASGTSTVSGGLSRTLADAILSAAGGSAVGATLAATLAGATLAAEGSPQLQVVVDATLASATLISRARTSARSGAVRQSTAPVYEPVSRDTEPETTERGVREEDSVPYR